MTTLRHIACALLLSACDPSELTDGEPCAADEDCSRKQSCHRTQAERDLDLPGVCSEQGGDCVHGQQLGCGCTPEQYQQDCTIPALALFEGYPAMECDPELLVCVVPTDGEDTEGG